MKKIVTSLLAVFVFGTFVTYGQYNVLLNFTGTNGSEPVGGVTISGNNIYGTTSVGGAGSGCIYKLHRDGSGYQDLFDFTIPAGTLPNATVTLYNGKLYGTTWEGGSFRYYGTVYSVDTDGTNYKVLLNFNDTNGDNPPTDLLLSGSGIYGIAAGGGFYGGGCIFKIDTDGNNYKDLYDFSASSGDAPYCKLLLVGTKFYGTTFDAGTYGQGTIFSIDTNGSNYTVMYNFGGSPDASNPYATLTLVGNTLFGTTYYGGTGNKGALFSININGNGYKKIFDFTGANGANPNIGSLKFEGNRLWGMASNGGAHNNGIVYSIDTNGSAFIDRFDFNGTVGATPDGQLTFYGPSLYGETTFGGFRGDGIVFGADTNCFMGSTLVTSNITCNGANNGSASISVTGGASPYTYLWSNSSTQSSISNLIPGTYSVTLTDNSGQCTQTLPFTITQPAVLSGITAGVVSPISCHGGNNGEANANVSNGASPYHYSWVNAAHIVVSTFNPTGPFLSAGIYTVTVTDNCSASSTASVTITQPGTIRDSASSVTNEICTLLGNATIGVKGGTPLYTYNWSPGGYTTATVSALTARVYTVTVADINGCSGTPISITIKNMSLKDSISLLENVGCFGGNGGEISVGTRGGTTPYTYSWSDWNTKYRQSGLTACTYTITVKDHAGCSNTLTATVTQPAAALQTGLVAAVNPSCHGQDGSATVTATGGTSGYVYTWSPNVSSSFTCTTLTAGSYTATAHDIHGCMSTLHITITQPNAIRDTMVAADKVNVQCNGESNGSATVGVKYGTSPYNYSWSNGQTSATATSLSAGIYSVTVIDANGCSGSTAITTITQPAAALAATFGAVTCNNSLVKVTITATGGTFPYSYAWSPGGGTKATMSGLAEGTYTVTVTDKHGCSYTVSSNLICILPVVKDDMDGLPSTLQCCHGINDIMLYPNPNNGQFTLTGLTHDMTIEMYDYTGRKILSQLTIDNSQLTINISDQPNGIYLIRILEKDGNLVSQKKVIKTN